MTVRTKPKSKLPTRQWTIKGVDQETIDLVRAAASHKGMKIQAFVNRSLKKAAQQALQENE